MATFYCDACMADIDAEDVLEEGNRFVCGICGDILTKRQGENTDYPEVAPPEVGRVSFLRNAVNLVMMCI